MKILSVALVLMASLAFVLLGCSDNSSPVVSPTDQVLSSPTSSTGLAKAGVEVIHSLRGSANAYYTLWYGPDGSVWGTIPGPKQKGRFYNVETVQADAYSSGTASGSFRYQFLGKLPPSVEGGFFGKVEGKVIKLAVEGNKAFLVVEVTKWELWPLPAWFAQVFVDNGEGASSSDELSQWFVTDAPDVDPGYGSRDFWLTMDPDAFISWSTDQLEGTGVPVLFPIDHGNIQVR
ncbi:MAG: hypothetical protein H6Q30_1839 [Bacteroidetes bacterium]|nr:hypothetical protein [Bacteroidota bacterium]